MDDLLATCIFYNATHGIKFFVTIFHSILVLSALVLESVNCNCVRQGKRLTVNAPKVRLCGAWHYGCCLPLS